MKRFVLAIIVGWGLGLFSLPGLHCALAFGVTPIHVEMSSAGRSSRAQITVSNDSSTAVPVELSIERITLDERGQRRSNRSGDGFLVFPPQAMIAPGSVQVFRLQWVGEPHLAASESYMVYVNQIPVKATKGRAGVQVVSSMGVLVNVAPPTGIPDLKLVGSGIAAYKGKRFPTITVENPSNVHALLPASRIRLSAAGWSHTFEANELGNLIGIGLVEPGKRRRFVLPVSLPPGISQVQASLEFRPNRR
jgi:fimbrial chaperone protein